MKKLLTEKWKDGELPDGWYYLKVKSELANYPVIAECVINYSSSKPYSDFYEYDDSHIKEILSPVPSYDEWQSELASNDELLTVQKRLEKKLEIATKALKDIVKDYDINGPCEEDCVGYYMCHTARKALKEMKEEE